MAATYDDPPKKESGHASLLAGIAAELHADGPSCRLAPLIFMTDPIRVPDPISVVRRLPKDCAVIYRHFGAPDHAESLREITRDNGQQLLIGNDPDLAESVGADGVHFTRDAWLKGPITWRAKHPKWIITMPGLKTGAYLAPLDSLDALFISSIFPSQSPSPDRPLARRNCNLAQRGCPFL